MSRSLVDAAADWAAAVLVVVIIAALLGLLVWLGFMFLDVIVARAG